VLEAAVVQLDAAKTFQHAFAAKAHRSAGSVTFTRHRGGGQVTSDYLLQFEDFNTFVADVRLCGGCFFFELHVIELGDIVQFGICTQGFEPRKNAQGEGVGDDSCSRAVDGVRKLKWHQGKKRKLGSKWAKGGVIGFAVDMRTTGNAVMSVSVNGSFGDPNGVAFNNISAAYLSPAFTGYSCYRANMSDRPYLHAPPDAEYVSVQEFDQRNARPECAEDDERPVSGVFLPALLSADAYAREFELRVRILNLEHSAYFGSS
jgi:hypothetical protein